MINLDPNTIFPIIGAIASAMAIIAGLYKFAAKFRIWIRDSSWTSTWPRLIGLLILVLVVASILGSVVGRVGWSPPLKSIAGNVYYKTCDNSPGRDAAADVTVFVSDHREFKSAPTGDDGYFVIEGIPGELPIHQLIARSGGQDFPAPPTPTGVYVLIPRPCPGDTEAYPLQGSWKSDDGSKCVLEGTSPAHLARFTFEETLFSKNDKREAACTVELINAPDVRIESAFVLSPSQTFYRNETISGQDPSKAHTWVFTLSQSGLPIKLEICVGSNVKDTAFSSDQFQTYCELR